MTALDGLTSACMKRGWRVGLTVDEHHSPSRLLHVEVRGVRAYGERELLARSSASPGSLESACVELARSLEAQGLLT